MNNLVDKLRDGTITVPSGPISQPIGVYMGNNQLQNMNNSQLIHSKMAAILSEIGSIGKDQKNVAQGFKFRGIDQFINALHPLLAKHKVYVCPKVSNKTEKIVEVLKKDGTTRFDKHVTLDIAHTFVAEDGSSVTFGPIAAEGIDTGDKATNKALSSGLKYNLIQGFMVPTEDMAEADFESPTISAPVTRTADPAPVAEKVSTAAVPEVAKKAGSSFKRPAKQQAVEPAGDDSWE